MDLNIYLNSSAESPRVAFVNSELNPVPVGPMSFVYWDTLRINLYLVDGAGNFDANSGSTGLIPKLVMGLPGQGSLAGQNSWSQIANGWFAQVPLKTDGLKDLLSSQESERAFLQITITDIDGNLRTYGLMDFELLNPVSAGDDTIPSPTDSYSTTTESLASYLQNRTSVTGLTGGGSTNLDGLATLGVAVGCSVIAKVSGMAYIYQLVAGTDAEASPTVIRPDDYNASTNAKVWKLISFALGTSGALPMFASGAPFLSPSCISYDGTRLNSSRGCVISGTVGSSGTYRSDTGIEVQADTNAGISLYKDSDGFIGDEETFLVFGSQNSIGEKVKTASISSGWTSVAGLGTLRLNVCSNTGGNSTDHMILKGYGNNSAAFFTDAATPPSPDTVDVHGYINVIYNGSQVVGSVYLNSRFRNSGATKGVWTGYDNSVVRGYIGSDQSSSTLGVVTHDGSAWGERARFGGGDFRTDSQFELLATNPILSLYQNGAGSTSNVGALLFGAKDSGGAAKKIGGLLSSWVSTNATTGYSLLRLMVTTAGGGTDDVPIRLYGGKGITIFGTSDGDEATAGMVLLRGFVDGRSDGAQLVGNIYTSTGFYNSGATKGVLFGYDSSAVRGYIVSKASNSTLGVVTHDGSAWAERARFGGGTFRSDSQLELFASSPIFSLLSTVATGTTTEAESILFGAYDAGGTVRKVGFVGTKWADATASTGFGVLRLCATKTGGTVDDVAVRIFGGAGVEVFGSSDTSGPGDKVFQVDGYIQSRYDGATISGNFKYFGDYRNAAGTKGVLIGYETSISQGIISSVGSTSGLALWTHNGSAWGARITIGTDGHTTNAGNLTVAGELIAQAQTRIGTTNWPSTNIGNSAGRHIINGTNQPVLILWNEAAAAANNVSSLWLGAKSASGSTTIGGARIDAGLVNNTDGKGYIKFYTTNSSNSAVLALTIDETQQLNVPGLTASRFVTTDGSKNLISFSLFGTANTWQATQIWEPPAIVAGAAYIGQRLTGDTTYRWATRVSSGADKIMLWWGDGTTEDTNLYRSAADTLKTDDDLVIGTLAANGILTNASGKIQVLTVSKTTAAAPYTNDGYITVTINGTSYKLMTTT